MKEQRAYNLVRFSIRERGIILSGGIQCLISARYQKLRELQERLTHAAKAEPKRRFYTLKDKVYCKDVLECAWESVKSNSGSPGIDA